MGNKTSLMPLAPPATALLDITGINDSGEGTTTLDNTKVHIPYALPGETVEALLFKKRKGSRQGLLKDVITPSQDRTRPLCPHFGNCGGCKMQHMALPKQSAWKQKRVQTLFPDVSFAPLISSPQAWRYRNKMEYSFACHKSGMHLGLYSKKGRVTDLQECLIAPEWFSLALQITRNFWHKSGLPAFDMRTGEGILRNLCLRETQNGGKGAYLIVSKSIDCALWASAMEKAYPGISLALKLHIAQKGQATRFEIQPISGPAHLQETLCLPSFGSLTFYLSPTSFFQPNPKAAALIYESALQLAAIQSCDVVYDLFCGTGTLGCFAAKKARQVYGIEILPQAVAAAQETAAHSGLANIEFFAGDVYRVLENSSLPRPNLCIVDPPRAGLGAKACALIAALRPEKMVYISCNPTSQHADCQYLKKEGYTIASMQIIDQFPHTPHVESIALLKKL